MELLIPLKAHGSLSMYQQIYEYIKQDIRAGNLAENTRLPSTRVLAENLKVSRSTTQMAYDQLVAEGYIQAVPHRGYFVLRVETLAEVEPETEGPFIREGTARSGGKTFRCCRWWTPGEGCWGTIPAWTACCPWNTPCLC